MKNIHLLVLMSLCLTGGFPAVHASDFAKVSKARLDNGLQIIFIENHANPVVMSGAVLNAGSRFEDGAFSGASHMLEHLLFNGTTHRTQKELYDETDRYGIYNNATTMQSCVFYMMLGPAEYADKILEIQSDMLYNSTLPEEKFEKERGIVLEELNKDMDRKEYIAERLFRQHAYPMTPYALPVLGTVETITNMSRDKVWDYYQAHYVPGNTTLFLMGDFETETMLEKVKASYYGTTKSPTTVPHITVKLPDITGQGRNLKYYRTETNQAYLDLAFNAPKITDPDWAAFQVLSEIISTRLRNQLQGHHFLTIGASYETNADFGRLRVSATAKDEPALDRGITEIITVLNDIGTFGIQEKELQNVIIRTQTDELFVAERLHYYVMMKAAQIATGGWDFVLNYSDRIANVTTGQVNMVAQKYFSRMNYTGTVLANGTPNFDLAQLSPLQLLPEGKIDPRTRTELELNLTPEPLTLISQSESIAGSDQQSIVIRKVLANGLTVIVDQNPDSRVFAVHLMAKHRSLREPEGKAGIADILHRMLLLGTANKSREELDQALSGIGAEVLVTDRDFIPFDDYYTTPEFSFVRFKTIDDFYETGLDIFTEMIIHPALTPENFEQAKEQLLGVLGRKQESVKETARRLFAQALYGDHPLAQSPFGTIETVNSITFEDMQAFYPMYFAANNLVLSIVTNLPAESIMATVESRFGELPPTEYPLEDMPPLPVTQESKTVENNQETGRAQIYIGTIFPIEPADEAALDVATSILSDRMMFDLRETRGWAYSIGASFSKKGTFGKVTLGMGTNSGVVNDAVAGMQEQIRQMAALTEIDSLEVEKTINSMIYRQAMRTMAREGQAYRYAMRELEGLPMESDTSYTQQLRTVQPADVVRVAQHYLNTDKWVTVIAQ